MTFEYAPAPESRSIVSIKPKYGHFINGSFVAGKKHFPTINPATEEILSHIALGGTSDVDKAVMAAQKAYTRRGRSYLARSGESTSIALHVFFKSEHVSSQFLKLLIMESQSAKPAI